MRLLFIIFVIAFALITLSCMEHNQDNFDDIRTEERYIPNYKVTLERKCAENEKDMGTYCEKEGCPSGFERGRGANKLMCYPQCLSLIHI